MRQLNKLHLLHRIYLQRAAVNNGLYNGQPPLLEYVEKHPGCTQAELTAALGLDWGYSQRSVTRLVEEGFLIREKSGRAYHAVVSPGR